VDLLIRDLRYGIRVLARNPGFTCAAVATLALSLAANTAILGVADAVLLRPLPYPDPDRLVEIRGASSERGLETAPLSNQRFLALAERNASFSSLGAWTTDTINLTGVPEPVELHALRVSPGVLETLGVRPDPGRNFLPVEEVRGGPPVVLLGREIWSRRFGSDPGVAGRTISLGGVSHTVVGVLPRGLAFPDGAADIWIPRVAEPAFLSAGAVERGAGYLNLVARLKAGVTPGAARAELDLLAKNDPRADGLDAGMTYRMAPLKETLTRGSRPALLLLLGSVGFVLLIACANVANLMLAKSTGRRREIALRSALGAGRARIVALLLTESLLLAFVAGVLGLLLARWGIDLLVSAGASGLPRAGEIRLDGRIAAATIALSLLSGLVFGIGPALSTSSGDVAGSLKEGGGNSAGGNAGRRLRGGLVVAEVALSVVLLIGAGLLLRSFVRLQAVETGFDAAGLLVAQTHLPASRYAQPAAMRDFYSRLVGDVETLPGVVSAGASESLPLGEPGAQTLVAVDGAALPPPGERAVVSLDTVSPGYFRTMGIPLRKGRLFTPEDGPGAPIKVVVSTGFARRFFPGADPIGRRVVLGRGATGFEIVGVVGDVRHGGLDESPAPSFYLCSLQRTVPRMSLIVRTAGAAPGLASAIRERVRSIDPDQPVARIATMDEIIGGSLADRRFLLRIVGAFALAALLLAAVGIYGVTAYAVGRRAPEMGIRIALGAGRRDLVGMVVGETLRLTLAGAAIGVACALAAGPALSGFLYGVGAGDPATIALIVLLLTAVSILAAWAPARRAARIDPAIALRSE